MSVLKGIDLPLLGRFIVGVVDVLSLQNTSQNIKKTETNTTIYTITVPIEKIPSSKSVTREEIYLNQLFRSKSKSYSQAFKYILIL